MLLNLKKFKWRERLRTKAHKFSSSLGQEAGTAEVGSPTGTGPCSHPWGWHRAWPALVNTSWTRRLTSKEPSSARWASSSLSVPASWPPQCGRETAGNTSSNLSQPWQWPQPLTTSLFCFSFVLTQLHHPGPQPEELWLHVCFFWPLWDLPVARFSFGPAWPGFHIFKEAFSLPVSLVCNVEWAPR